jgi:tRNA(Ser,Leu) C12 N-acetylase TAN1
MENTKQYYQTVIIREYLWSCGDGDEIMEGFYRVAEDDVDFDDYNYIITLIDDYVPYELIQQFDSLGDMRAQFIDEYEEKIIKIINKKVEEIKTFALSL